MPFCVFQMSLVGQNYIGMHKDEILKQTPKDFNGFVFEKEVSNANKSFIKFVNTYDEQTLLFMINENGYCTSISRMYNTWLYDQIYKELSKKYKKKGPLTWIEKTGNKEFEIKLKRGEWFITVTTRPANKK